MNQLEYKEITHEELTKWNLEDDYTYGVIGMQVYRLSPRWQKAGVQIGEFVCSSSHTGDINTAEKMQKALGAPDGTILLFQRVKEGKIQRRTVTL